MKIAINCSYFLPKGGGIKEYIYNLVKNIVIEDTTNDYVFYVFKNGLKYWQKQFGFELNVKTIPFNSSQRIKAATLGHLYWYKEIRKEKIDIFHSPFFHLPMVINAKKIVTVHDIRFIKFPDTYGKIRYTYLKYAVPASLTKAKKIIAISQFTKNEIVNEFNISPKKIKVIHEAIDNERFKPESIDVKKQEKILASYGLNKKGYLISVGHVEQRKNYDALLRVFNKLDENIQLQYKLVIIGQMKTCSKYFKNIIHDNANIIYLDFVDEDALLTLYENAKLFVFPSYYEGFGFPPLEAASFGIPSVASNVSSIPEICGEGALFFDPFNDKDIEDKILMALTDKNLYLKMKQSSIQNLTKYTWRKNAIETIKIYDEVYRG